MTRAEIVAELRTSHLHMYDGSRDGHGMKVFKLCTAAADAIVELEREVQELKARPQPERSA